MVVYCEPTTGGSGVPDVKSYCNGVILPGVLRFRTYCIRIVGLILVTYSGLFAGTEGPMAHVGAICAAGISMGRFTTYKQRLLLQDDLNTHKVKLNSWAWVLPWSLPLLSVLHWWTSVLVGGGPHALECTVDLDVASLLCSPRLVRKALCVSRWRASSSPLRTPAARLASWNISNPDDVILGDPVRWLPWELLPHLHRGRAWPPQRSLLLVS